jgi:hypothetical protein
MIYCPPNYKGEFEDINKKLREIEGTLDIRTAESTLFTFFKHNLRFFCQLMLNIELDPYQEMLLKGALNRNFSLFVMTRGGGKSFLMGVFVILHSLLESNSQIIISGPTFRTSKFIFEYAQKIIEDPKNVLLRQCMKDVKGNNGISGGGGSVLKMDFINGASVRAVPFSDKIRGFRANVLICDEFLLMSEEMVTSVLKPFLVARSDIKEYQRIKRKEDILVQKGLISHSERTPLTNKTKMISLSSASFTFNYLYETYLSYRDLIYGIIKEGDQDEEERLMQDASKYFLAQISYKAIPEHILNRSIINEAKETYPKSLFDQEYGAKFTDGSDGFFSARKMQEVTIPNGDEPHTRIIGAYGKEYILAIDPSFSDSPLNDHFAMTLLEFDEGDYSKGTVVHSYAGLETTMPQHIKYLHYLYTHFNISFIIIDNAGKQFLESANASDIFIKDGINLKFIREFDPTLTDREYISELSLLNRQYDKSTHTICYAQYFGKNHFINKANQCLQEAIHNKNVWFASKTRANNSFYDKESSRSIPKDLISSNSKLLGESILEFIELQDDMIDLTKKECSLIEVKINPQGTRTFDLPSNVKSSKSKNRARRDNYTTLMLACWARKFLYDSKQGGNQKKSATFAPFFI